MATSETLIPIPGRLKSVAVEEHVAGADMIYDDEQEQLQSQINDDLITNKADKSATVSNVSFSTSDSKIKKTINGVTTDVIGPATESLAGLMSSGDKGKLNALPTDDELTAALDTKVDKVTGKQLSEEDFTSTLKTKLDGIAEGAEVNVNADWNADEGDARILNKPVLAEVAISGSYEDLTDRPSIPDPQVNSDWTAQSGIAQILHKPTLGTAAAKDYVTTIDQSSNLITSGAVKAYAEEKHGEITVLIPTAATTENQLADKAFVNSSITTATANYKGNYNAVSDLQLTADATHAQIATALKSTVSGADNNDYAFVQIPSSTSTPTEIAKVERYKYNETDWSFEYELNNSGFTAEQWAAINSAVTSALVTKLINLPTNEQLTTTLGTKADKSSTVSAVSYDGTNKKITQTVNGTTTNVVTTATLKKAMQLNNVGNFKAVSTVANQGLTDTEKSNARTNIGAGAITGINMNGASKGTSGVVDLGTVITAHQDISGKANKNEMSVTTGTGTATITLKSGTSATVLTTHQDISGKADKSATVSTVTYDATNKKITKTINGVTTDVVAAATIVEDGGGIPSLNYLTLSALAHNYTFNINDALVIDGVVYKCTAQTTKPPFNFVFDANNSIVYETIDGNEAYAVDSNTLNSGWAVAYDMSDRHYAASLNKQTNDRITSVNASLNGSISNLNTSVSNLNTSVSDLDTEKADKATTLAGYGITDAYTKTQIDTSLSTKQNTLEFESSPTKNSTKMLNSGVLYRTFNKAAAWDFDSEATNVITPGLIRKLTNSTSSDFPVYIDRSQDDSSVCRYGLLVKSLKQDVNTVQVTFWIRDDKYNYRASSSRVINAKGSAASPYNYFEISLIGPGYFIEDKGNIYFDYNI